MSKTRKNYFSKLKAQVALAALCDDAGESAKVSGNLKRLPLLC